MDLKRLFEGEFTKAEEEERQLTAELEVQKEKEREEKNRVQTEEQRFRALVERTYTLLKPVLDQFITLANQRLRKGRFVLSREKVMGSHTYCRYKVIKKEDIDFDVLDISFGYNFYDTLFIVRIDTAANHLNYSSEDVLANDIAERFVRDLVENSTHYMKSYKEYL